MSIPTLPEAESWTALAEDWQAGEPRVAIDVPALRHRVETERRRMVGAVAGGVVVTVGCVVGPAYLLVRHPGPESTFLAIDSWVAVVAAWAFSIWSSRGNWKPLAETTEMFLVLERRRGLARLQGARAALVFLILQCLTVWLWTRLRPAEVAPTESNRVLLVLPATIIVAVIVMAVRAHRQVPPMVAEVDRLLAELRRPDNPA